MFRVRPTVLAAVAYVALAGVADACIGPPPPIQLPGESDEAYKIRTQAVYRALGDEGRRRFQVTLYDKSNRIRLAMVEHSSAVDAMGSPGRQVVVEPVATFKGEEQPIPVTLTDLYWTSCGMAGGGPATAAQRGEFIILFEGDLFEGRATDRYGIKMEDLREPRLLEAVNAFALAARERAEVR